MLGDGEEGGHKVWMTAGGPKARAQFHLSYIQGPLFHIFAILNVTSVFKYCQPYNF